MGNEDAAVKVGEQTSALAVPVHSLVVGRADGQVQVVVESAGGVLVGHCHDCTHSPLSLRTGFVESQKQPSTHWR